MKKLSLHIFLVMMFCNVGFADLNGKKLYCYAEKSNKERESHAALVFIENMKLGKNIKQVKFSFMRVYNSTVGHADVLFQKTFNYYEVGEKYIEEEYKRMVPNGKIKKTVQEGVIHIDSSLSGLTGSSIVQLDRRTLVLKVVGALSHPHPICEIVDYDPLEKFRKIYRNALTKEEKKENKI